MSDAFARAGVEPHVVYESDEIETVQALVEAGLGVSLVPRMVKRPGLAYLEVSAPAPARTIHLTWRDESVLSPAALAMKKIILDIL